MNVLFVHQNFPGQFGNLAFALKNRGENVFSIGHSLAKGLSDIPILKYSIKSDSYQKQAHPWCRDFTSKVLRAEAVASKAFYLKKNGFIPDLIIGHPGWGELLAIKDVFPNTPVIYYLEFFYQYENCDFKFDPEFLDYYDLFSRTKLSLKRLIQLHSLNEFDKGILPTFWQASTVPEAYRNRICVIHDGIKTDICKPNNNSSISLKNAKLNFTYSDEVVTFVARNLEPYRGFHVFMRSLPLLQTLRPNCHIIIVGGDDISYGFRPKESKSWREFLLNELRDSLDMTRIHFVGKIPYKNLINLFQISKCHVYLTYPFVLGWSVLEAMSCGCCVVASATSPVKEVINNYVNGILIDFFDKEAISYAIAKVLSDKSLRESLGVKARETILKNYDLEKICLPKQFNLIDGI